MSVHIVICAGCRRRTMDDKLKDGEPMTVFVVSKNRHETVKHEQCCIFLFFYSFNKCWRSRTSGTRPIWLIFTPVNISFCLESVDGLHGFGHNRLLELGNRWEKIALRYLPSYRLEKKFDFF